MVIPCLYLHTINTETQPTKGRKIMKYKILNSKEYYNGQIIEVFYTSEDESTLNSPRSITQGRELNPEFKKYNFGRKHSGWVDGRFIPKYREISVPLDMTRCEEIFGRGSVAVFVSDETGPDMVDGDTARDEAYSEFDCNE